MRGQSGYVDSEVTITVDSPYSGAGVAGLNPLVGLPYKFKTKIRESEFVRGRQDTTGEAYRSSVTSEVSRRISLVMYYKGRDYPPDFELYEYVYLEMTFGKFSRQCVVHVESFRNTGDVERALEYTMSGETDGIVTQVTNA